MTTQERRRPGRRLSVGTALAAAGVLVAIGAWLWPVDPGSSPAPTAAPTTVAPVPSPPGPAPSSGAPSPGDPSSGAPAGPHRFLTELVPFSGGSSVQRTGEHSLIMRCGTGESDDRDREVVYDIPPSGYQQLRTTARPTGRRETRVQVSVLVDGVVKDAPVLAAGSARLLSVPVAGASRVTLRITCDVGAASTTFVDPELSAVS